VLKVLKVRRGPKEFKDRKVLPEFKGLKVLKGLKD
jgi:hypothetical protein